MLTRDRAELYRRIDRRVDAMLAQGLLEEVRALKELGCTRQMTSMQGLGYKELFDYLEGRLSLEEAVYLLKRDTRHFAKRQMTWFRRERDAVFFSMDSRTETDVLAEILEQFKKSENETGKEIQTEL